MNLAKYHDYYNYPTHHFFNWVYHTVHGIPYYEAELKFNEEVGYSHDKCATISQVSYSCLGGWYCVHMINS